MTNTGTIQFSFDFEIGWGDITNGRWLCRQNNNVYTRLRKVLPKMLKLMDTHEFPATWATVGAMIDDPSHRDFHHLSEHQATIVNNALSISQNDTFNGKDLFEMVLNTKQKHAIACHSYSHIPFNFTDVNGQFVREDLNRFNQTLKNYDLCTDTLVFPENTERYLDEVYECGFRRVRVPADNFFKNRYLYLATLAFIPPPPSINLSCQSGLIRHCGSMLFNDAAQPHRIPLLNRRVSMGLAKATRNKSDLHIWAHPFNFAESEGLLQAFENLLEDISHLREQGKLGTTVM